jgi:disulfide bond formation protein DsbB
MTRLQRLGLLVILAVLLLMQAGYVEVLAHYTPAHLPLATRVMLVLALVGGGLAWMMEPRDKT